MAVAVTVDIPGGTEQQFEAFARERLLPPPKQAGDGASHHS
jgi:hypothetical protein